MTEDEIIAEFTNLKQLEKCLDRKRRNLPYDRIIKSVDEVKLLFKDVECLMKLYLAQAKIVNKMGAELDAFKAAGAASMETHNTEET